jgi:hypothetical protein
MYFAIFSSLCHGYATGGTRAMRGTPVEFVLPARAKKNIQTFSASLNKRACEVYLVRKSL